MTEHLNYETKYTTSTEGEIEGLAICFDQPDSIGDVVSKGAFARSLREHQARGRMPPMLWSHDPREVIGRWTDIVETVDGLRVRGRLNLQTQRGAEARALLLDGSISGLSIGFRAKASQRRPQGRLLTDIDLVETSLCSLPCVPDARVTSVKDISMLDDTETTPEITTLEPVAELTERVAGIENKMAGLAQIADLGTRLDKVETRLSRPGARLEVKDDREALERKAFVGWCRRGLEGLDDVERKVLQSTAIASPASQGWQLVPEVFSRELIRNLVELSPMRQVARVQNVTGGPVLVPKRTANLTAGWVAETVEHATSEPTYDQRSVGVFECRVTVEVTNQLLEDSAFDLSTELARDFAEEFARLEGAAFVAGDGITQPEGFLAGEDWTSTAVGIDGADDLVNLLYSVPSVYAQRGTWLMSRATMGAIRLYRSAVDGPFIWVDSLAAGQPPTLLGRPVVEMPGLAAASSASPAGPVVGFGDWSSAYRIFDRVGLEVLRDPYTKAKFSIVCFHARKRVGGALVNGAAVAGIT